MSAWKRLKGQAKQALGVENMRRITALQVGLPRLAHRSLRRSQEIFGRRKRSPQRPVQGYAVAGCHTFFGYYDVTPFSSNNSLLLAIAAPPVNRTPRPEEPARVGYFHLGEPESFEEIGQTSAWCWQMGCRLQWLPGGGERWVIYNTLLDGAFGAVVQDVNGRQVLERYDRPVYSIDPSGRWALSLNFARLQRLRPGYGYVDLPDETRGRRTPSGDGLWLIDLHDGKADLLFSLQELADLAPETSMASGEHYINHLSFNPTGDRLMFFHLWTQGRSWRNRMITCDLQGCDLHIYEAEGILSHYTWLGPRALLVTAHHHPEQSGYYVYDDETGERVRFAPGLLTRDGHPSVVPGSRWLLTDTYADRYGEQGLLLYAEPQGVIELGRFGSPARFWGETRCDLHPRYDSAGRRVAFDSAHTGRRGLYVMDLEGLL